MQGLHSTGHLQHPTQELAIRVATFTDYFAKRHLRAYCKIFNDCAAQGTACNTALHRTAPMWAAHTIPQQVEHIYLALWQPQWRTAWLETMLITLLGLVSLCAIIKARLDLIIGFRSWFCIFLACTLFITQLLLAQQLYIAVVAFNIASAIVCCIPPM